MLGVARDTNDKLPCQIINKIRILFDCQKVPFKPCPKLDFLNGMHLKILMSYTIYTNLIVFDFLAPPYGELLNKNVCNDFQDE